jgi:hypothetical protein
MTPGEQRIMDKALRRSTHLVAPTPSVSDLSNAAKAWYTHIAPQPTVHGRIQGLAAVLAEAVENAHHEWAKYAAAIIDQAKAEQHTVDVAALRYIGFGAAADFLEQRK